MPKASVHLNHFIRRVYGRMLVWRALESAGVGLFAGCVAALIASCVAIYQGRPAAGLVLSFLPLASLGGMIWFIWRRPRVLDAAMEADRQLGLSDLLSTAWMLRREGGDGAFPAAVLATAEARCARLSPRAVRFGRLGRRSWGGIGLATALVAAMTLVSVDPVDSKASDPRAALLDAAARSERPRGAANASMIAAAVAPRAIAFDELGQDPHSPDSATESGPGRRGLKTNGTDSTNSAADPTGTGGGSGRTNTADAGERLNPGGSDSVHLGGSNAAGGGGASTEAAGSGRGNSGTAGGSVDRHRPAPVWSSAAWPAAQGNAGAALRSGQVPPAYHDLVREYFGL